MALISRTFSDIITFTRASSATFVGANGLIQTAGNNVPRFEYDPITLAARGLLVEESRTNVVLRSQEFDNTTNWIASHSGSALAVTRTPNAGVAPDGTVTATRIQCDCGGSAVTDRSSFAQSSLAVVNGGFNTGSLWVKAYDAANVGKTLRITSDGMASVVVTLTSSWQRTTFSGIAGTSATNFIIETRGTFTTQTADALIWGAQIEVGAFATSYIPTAASAATRAADSASVNTISPWFNAAEGTLFAEGSGNSVGNSSVAALRDSGNSYFDQITLDRAANNKPRFTGNAANISQWLLEGTGFAAGVVVRLAGAYKQNDFAASFSGSAAVADLSGAVPSSIARLEIGRLGNSQGEYLNGHIRRIAYYPRRLSNAELQALTA